MQRSGGGAVCRAINVNSRRLLIPTDNWQIVEGMQRIEILRAAGCVAGADHTIVKAEKPLLDRLAREAGVVFASLEAMIERATQNRNFYRERFRVLSPDPKTIMA